MRRSGLILALIGLLAMALFWLTDPRFGLWTRAGVNPVDAANEALWGTLLGLAGSALVIVIGLWIALRRSV